MKIIKNTKQRQIILNVLASIDTPQTAKEIYTQAALIAPDIAKTTIYRNIDSLFSNGVISRYRFDKDKYSYKLNTNIHNHYLLCKKCNELTSLKNCPIADLENSVLKDTGFIVTNHSIELYGFCKKCKP